MWQADPAAGPGASPPALHLPINAGAWAEMEIDTRLPPAVPSNASATVWLAFLKSYAHMGVADVACVAGCACPPSRLDGTTEHRISLLMPFIWQASENSPRAGWVGAVVECRWPSCVPRLLHRCSLCNRLRLAAARLPTLPTQPQVSQHEACRIRVTVSGDAGRVPSGEHKVVLAAIVISLGGVPMGPWR